MRKVLFCPDSLSRAELFFQSSKLLNFKSYFLCFRLDIFLFLKLKGAKVFLISTGRGKIKSKENLQRLVCFEIEKRKIFGLKNNKTFFEKIAFRKNKIISLINQLKPDLAIVWNGFKFEDRVICSKIKTLFLEKGFLPLTLQADISGVNFLSSLRKKLARGRRQNHNGADGGAERIFKKIKNQVEIQSQKKPNINFKEIIGEWLFAPRGQRFGFLKKILKSVYCFFRHKDIEIKSDFWLVPLQQDFDSQILFFSPYFGSKKEFVSFLLKYMPKKENLVFRVHPKDLGKEDFEELKKLILSSKRALLALKTSLKEHLESCKGVVAINSNTAIEALVFQKPVFCLGLAFYSKIEGVRVIKPNQIREITPFKFDFKRTYQKIYFLKKYLIKNEPKGLAQKIQQSI